VIRAIAVALAASALASCVVLPEEPPLPPPCNVTVDGSLDVSEWQGSQRIELTNGAVLWLQQTQSHLCFAVESGEAGVRYVDAFIADRAGRAAQSARLSTSRRTSTARHAPLE
jgi:hypothetical protein